MYSNLSHLAASRQPDIHFTTSERLAFPAALLDHRHSLAPAISLAIKDTCFLSYGKKVPFLSR